MIDLNGSGGGNDYSTSYTEGASSARVANSAATITDADSTVVHSLTVSISNIADGASEVLSYNTSGVTTGVITGNYDSATGVLTLTQGGGATPADFQAVLRTIRYINTSQNPTGNTRLITFVAQDFEGNDSVTRTTSLTVVPVNDTPIVGGTVSNPNGAGLIADQTADIDGSVGPIAYGVFDFETASTTLTVTASSSNTALIDASGISVGASTGVIFDNTPGSDTRNLTLTPKAGQSGTAIITLTVSDGTLTSTTSFTLTVADRIDVGFSTATANVSEGAGTLLVVVTRTGSTAAFTVDYSIGSGSANLGSDLTPSPTTGTLSFASGETSKTISIPITDDALFEGAENFGILLSNATGNALISSPTITITINDNDANPAPVVVSALSSRSVDEDGNQLVIDLSPVFSDNVGDTLTYSASSANTAIATTAVVGSDLYVTLVPNANTDAITKPLITYAATDSANNTTSRTFQLTVPGINDAPNFDAIGNRSLAAGGSAQTITLTGVDAGAANESAQTLAFTATSSDSSKVSVSGVTYTAGASTGSLIVTPLAETVDGPITITVTATDNGGIANGGADTLTRTFTVEVTPAAPANNAPQVVGAGVTDKTFAEDGAAQTFNVASAFSDADAGSNGQLTYSVVADNPALVSATVTGSDVTVTPVANANGTAVVTVRATDGGGLFVEDTFEVTVSPVNDLPTIAAIDPQSTNEDTSTSPITVTVGDIETAATNLTVEATSSNTALVAASDIDLTGTGATRALTITPKADANGTSTITVKVTDADGGVTTTTFVLTVNAINDAPTLDALGDRSGEAGDAAQTVTITGVSAGPANESGQTLNFSAVSNSPTKVSVSPVTYTQGASTASFVVTPLAATTTPAIITVTVTDNAGGTNSATTSFNFTVLASTTSNNAPQVVGAGVTDKNFLEDGAAQTFSVASAFSDPDSNTGSNGQLTYSVINDFNAALITATVSGNNLTVTPKLNAFGTTVVTVRATDGGGLFVEDTFEVTISPVNDLPTISGLNGTQSTTTGVPTAAIPFTVGDIETPAANLVVTFNSSNTALLPVSNIVVGGIGASRTITLSPVIGRTGTTKVNIIVTDADGGERTDSINLTVANSGAAPTITDLDPNVAAIVGTISIVGTNFTSVVGTGVYFGVDANGDPIPAASFTRVNNTLLQAVVPANVRNGKVRVITSGGTAQSAENFLLLPTISDFTPASGPIGSVVTINGTGFAFGSASNSNVSAVRFAGPSGTFVNVKAADLTIVSPTQITVKVPAGAITGKIRVQNAAGAVDSAATFTVTGAVSLVITSFSPVNGPVGTAVTVLGSGFTNLNATGGVSLKAGATTLTPSYQIVNNTTLKVAIPASAVVGTTYVIEVKDKNNAVTNTSTLTPSGFTVTNVPAITSITPARGKVGAAVTITGANFSNVTQINFTSITGKVRATFSRVNSTTVRAFVPAGAATGPIYATNGFGESPASDTKFVVEPELLSFTPASGPVGTLVTITGRSFDNVVGVTFNNINSGPRYGGAGNPTTGWKLVSPTQILVVVPAGATTGKIGLRYYLGGQNDVPLPVRDTALSATDFTVTAGGAAARSFNGF